MRPVIIAPGNNYDGDTIEVEKFWHCWSVLNKPPVTCCSVLMNILKKVKTRKIGKIFAINALIDNHPTVRSHKRDPNDIAFYQLTSGSTGKSKCIEERHNRIVSHILSNIQACQYSSDDVSLNWIPFDHVTPILTYHLRDIFLGRQQIQVENSLILTKPLMWLELMSKYQVTDSWCPNFGYKLLLQSLEKEAESYSPSPLKVKRLMSIGEAVVKETVQSLSIWLEKWGLEQSVIQPTFGMAETATCITFENKFNSADSVLSLAELQRNGDEKQYCVSLGKVVPGGQVRIVDEHDTLLPEKYSGRIQFKGPMLTTGYHVNPAINPQVNNGLYTEDQWLDSGDVGAIHNGRLFVTGRSKEIIIINGINYSCHEIESSVEKVKGVQITYIAAVGWSTPEGERFAILFVPEEGLLSFNNVARQETHERIANICRKIKGRLNSNLGINPTYVVPLPENEFFKTTSGKVQRERMRNSLLAGKYLSEQRIVDTINGENLIPVFVKQSSLQRHEPGAMGPISKKIVYMSYCDKLTSGIDEDINVLNADDFLAFEKAKQLVNITDTIVIFSDIKDIDKTIFLLARLLEIEKILEKNCSLFFVSRSEINSVGTCGEINAFATLLRQFSNQCIRWNCRYVSLDTTTSAAIAIEKELACIGGYEVAYLQDNRYSATVRNVLNPNPARETLSEMLHGGLCIFIGTNNPLFNSLAGEILKQGKHLLAIGTEKINEAAFSDDYPELYTYVNADVSDIALLKRIFVSNCKNIALPISAIFCFQGISDDEYHSWGSSRELISRIALNDLYVHNLIDTVKKLHTVDNPLMVFSSILNKQNTRMDSVFGTGVAYLYDQLLDKEVMTGKNIYSISWESWNTDSSDPRDQRMYSNTYSISDSLRIELLSLILSQPTGHFLVGTSNYDSNYTMKCDNDLFPTWEIIVNSDIEVLNTDWVDHYNNPIPVAWQSIGIKESTSDVNIKVSKILENVLGYSVADNRLTFTELGVDSVLFAQFYSTLQEEFGDPDVAILDVFNCRNIKDIGKIYSKL